MALPESTTARARVRWNNELVPVSVSDTGPWDVPDGHPRLLDYLGWKHPTKLYVTPWRVDGERAHDALQAAVDDLGGEMLTRKLPIPAAEPGVVY